LIAILVHLAFGDDEDGGDRLGGDVKTITKLKVAFAVTR
jgi:hypothetical protein